MMLAVFASCEKDKPIDPVISNPSNNTQDTLVQWIKFEVDSVSYEFMENDTVEYSSGSFIKWYPEYPGDLFITTEAGARISHHIDSSSIMSEGFGFDFHYRDPDNIHGDWPCYYFNDKIDFLQTFPMDSFPYQPLHRPQDIHETKVGITWSYSTDRWRSLPFYSHDTIPYDQTNSSFLITHRQLYIHKEHGLGLVIKGEFNLTLYEGYTFSGATRQINNGRFHVFINSCLNY